MAATVSMDEAAARVVVERAGATTGTGNAGDQRRRVVVPAGAQAGDLLLQDAPFAAVLLPALWATHCHVCFRPGDNGKLSRCGRCQTAYYCKRISSCRCRLSIVLMSAAVRQVRASAR